CLLTMVSVSALAQENRLEANIPFDFNVGKTAEVNATWIPATTWPSASQKIVVLPQVNAAWIPATTWPSASQKIVVLPQVSATWIPATTWPSASQKIVVLPRQ